MTNVYLAAFISREKQRSYHGFTAQDDNEARTVIQGIEQHLERRYGLPIIRLAFFQDLPIREVDEEVRSVC